MNPSFRFERLEEFNHVGRELGTRNREVPSQIVSDLSTVGMNVMAGSQYGVQEIVQDASDSGQPNRVPSTPGRQISSP